MSSSVIPPSPTSGDYAKEQNDSRAVSKAMFAQDDPLAVFEAWALDARSQEVNDSNAMSLATVDASGLPDVRVVLLKGVDARGFVFYTNANSAKGQHLQGQPKAALCFHWKSLRRQVRIRGAVHAVKGEEADAYFASRARDSQIGAWASDQSGEIQGEDTTPGNTLRTRMDVVGAQYEGQDIPRPDHWYGWRVVPQSIEFWVSQRYRLHDRLVFSRSGPTDPWRKTRLFP